jgi:hypothetical protein
MAIQMIDWMVPSMHSTVRFPVVSCCIHISIYGHIVDINVDVDADVDVDVDAAHRLQL